jgi:hypothetical protein
MSARFWSLLLAAVPAAWAAAQPAGKSQPPVILVNSTGQELKLTEVKFTQGARRLAWLADPKGPTDDNRRGPLALEVREPHSTTYQKGVVTLVPAASVLAIHYEYDKQEVSIAVKGLEQPLKGTLRYRGINAFGLEGKAGEILGRFTGGAARDGFRSVAFPDAKPLPTRPSGGLSWSIQIDQAKAGHPTVVVRDLKALYAFPGGIESLADQLPVRKTMNEVVAISSSLRRMEIIAVDPNTQMAVVEVTNDTVQDRLVAIPMSREQDGRTGTLIGLIGEVDAGWKLFPLHTIKVIQQGAIKP